MKRTVRSAMMTCSRRSTCAESTIAASASPMTTSTNLSGEYMSFDLNTTLQLIVSGLAMGSIYALVALGFILIYNAVGVVNFAQGDFVMFPSYIAVSFILPSVFVFGTVMHWQLPT